MGPVMGRTLLQQEGDEHRASRALVSPLFRAKLLERWRIELVEVVVHELIDRFASRGRADLVREFTFAFPVQVIARLMGLPREDYVRFQQLSIELLSVVYNWDIGIAASATLKEYFGEILAERRRDPQDDLISTLAESEIDGERLSDDEIFAFLLLILPAGVETTYRASGNLLVAMLTRAVTARDGARRTAACCAERSRRRCGGSRRSARWSGWRGATASLAGSRFPKARTSASASRRPTGTRRTMPTPTASTRPARTSRILLSAAARTSASACHLLGWRRRSR